ncbi:hypothetical protein [Deinococcus aquiradiocola]|uniref:Helix-turn-helix domain-containing protein n=1 Tax=Deinococcus aquiradiocola TaxID=393059 RepID=A0A917UWA7_9DEIO|nr:hypothetical protein [Deinococcus aquiradiocola]GGJ89931.1 hypothetical protein GCM10008939_37360 [Deinococcus aquiradiocola]
MSSFATDWAWKQHVQPAGRKFVLVALAEFADAEGACRVAQAELAEMTGQTGRSVLTHLAVLETAGLITREATRDEDGYRDLDVIRLMAVNGPRRNRAKPAVDDARPGLTETVSGRDSQGETVSRGPGRLPETVSPQGTSFLPYVRKDVPNTTPACETHVSGHTETGGGAGLPVTEHRALHATPDEAARDRTGTTGPGTDQRARAARPGTVNASGPVPPAGPYRAALNAIDTAGLTPDWAQWIRANALRPAAQEAQAPVWQAWIDAGHADTLKVHALDLVQSGGSFTHPWGALKARMRNASIPPAGTAPPAPVPYRPGDRVRYEDGSEAVVLDVRARGITTDHPHHPDVPIGRLNTLERTE